MANSEDEDAYLYGSDDEQPAAKRQKVTPAEPEKTPEQAPTAEQKDADEEEDDEGSEEESSDDDIEFVIGDSAPKAGSTVTTTLGPLNDTVGEVIDEDGDEAEDLGKKKSGTTIVAKSDTTSKIDVNAMAQYEGKPLTQLDLEELKDKPWRAPGADISDYFNYGFDELTWSAYCHKQDRLRGEFNPQKILAKIMGGPPGKPGKMPPMGNMPFPFPGMPGMPGFPNMANMPNMSNMPNMTNMPNMPNMPNMQNMGKMPPMPPNYKGQFKK